MKAGKWRNSLRWLMMIIGCVVVLFIHKQALAKQWAQLGTLNQPVVLSFLPNHHDKSKNSETDYYQGLLAAITKRYGIYFVVQQSDSYAAAVNDFCTGKAHIAVLGLMTYHEAKQRCNVTELLAVEVRNRKSEYFSGFFVHKKHGVDDIQQLSNRTLALGSPYSTSAFNYPLTMLVDVGIEPEHDFEHVMIMDNHTQAIKALVKEEVFAVATSFPSWQQAVNKGLIDPIYFKPLIKSAPIPNPPLVINKTLPSELQDKIKKSFRLVHTWENSEQLLNVARKIDRYDVTVDEQLYINAFNQLNKLDKTVKQRIISKYKRKVNRDSNKDN